MADNIKTPQGYGTDPPVATDEIGGTHYQVVKQAYGDPDSVTQVSRVNPLPVVPADAPTAVTGSVSSDGPLLSCDTTGYQVISLQLSGSWQGNVKFQASNDNSTWVDVLGYGVSSEMSAVEFIANNDIILIPCVGRYFKAVVWGLVSGTVVGTAYLRQQSLAGIGEAQLSQAMDPLNLQFLNVSPAGVDQPGLQPVTRSFPVALAREHIQDLFIPPRAWVAGNLNNNVIDPAGGATPVDCLQYRSIHVQIATGAGVTGAITFEQSNDLINWSGLFLEDPGASAAWATSWTLAASTTRLYSGAIKARYVRLRVSTILVGTTVVSAKVSMTPHLVEYLAVNPSYISGTAIVTGGLAGSQGVGGPSAIGVVPTYNPLLAGGVDLANLTRRVRTDELGNQVVTGLDPTQNAKALLNPVFSRLAISGRGEEDTDMLIRILAELRTISFYLSELPFMLHSNINFVDDSSDVSDEARIKQ